MTNRDKLNGGCEHLREIHEVTPSTNGCEDCLKTGDTWVHLRLCEICGHVGCCDNSKNKHATKLDRIVRILQACPGQLFTLLGDDSQQDPGIYASVVKHFPGRIRAVYLRQVHAGGRPAAEAALAEIKQAGVDTCYFEHSRDALRHSQEIGL